MSEIDLTWWLRIVGGLYLFMAFLVLVPRIPIRVELVGGIGIDVYKLARGYKRAAPLTWIVIHLIVITTGWASLGA